MNNEKITRVGDNESVAQRLARVRGSAQVLEDSIRRTACEATRDNEAVEGEHCAQEPTAAHLEPTLPLTVDGVSVASVATPVVSEFEAHRRRIANLTPIIITAPAPTANQRAGTMASPSY